MIDKQLLGRFKRFQDKTGKYEGFKLEAVEFEQISFSNTAVFTFVKGLNKYIRAYIDHNAGDVPVVGSSLENDCITSYIKPIAESDIITKQCVSFNKDNAKGSRAFFRDYHFVMDRHHLAVIPNTETVFVKYLYQFLDYFLQTKSYGWGTNVATVDEIQKYSLQIPKTQNEVYTSLKIQEILVEFIEYYQSDTNEKLDIIAEISQTIANAESLLLPLFFAKHPSVCRRFDAFCKAQKIDLKLKDLIFETKKLSELALLTMGQSPEGKDINSSGKGLPFHQGKTGYGAIYLKEATNWTEVGRKIAEKDDILISMRAPAGAINIAPYKTAIGRGLASIRCNTDVSRMYLYFYLKDNERKIDKAGENGGFFTSINTDYLVDFKINVPVQLNENLTSFYLQQLIIEFFKTYFDKMKERKDLTVSIKELFTTRNSIIIQKTFKPKSKK